MPINSHISTIKWKHNKQKINLVETNIKNIKMSMSSIFSRPRLVVKKVLARAQNEGDGAIVRRSIGR